MTHKATREAPFGGGDKGGPLRVAQAKGRGQAMDRIGVRPPGTTAFQLADRADAQPGPLGELLL
jgi:hypothetical protein